jgi:hypothetical protein
MAPGAEPLSIESLLQRQKEEREAAARVSSYPDLGPRRNLTFLQAQIPVQGGTCENRYCQAGTRDTRRKEKGRGESEEPGTTRARGRNYSKTRERQQVCDE